MKMKKALIPGTFDPVTLGHRDIVERAARIFDEVIVAVFDNSQKHTLFTTEQRLEMLKLALSGIENVRVDLSNGLLAAYAVENQVAALVKGVRNSTDFDYEHWLALINRSFESELDTVLLPSRSEYQHISSTVVRELIKYGRPTFGYVPDAVAEYINSTININK